MDPISGGCRLCLDPFAESFTSIENPELKDQMGKVFCFLVEVKQGFSSGVCQSCAYAISEFYQYSEKVRQNQEVLNGNQRNCDPCVVDCKISFESVKVEILEGTKDAACKSEEEALLSSNDESYEPSTKKSQSQRKGRPRKSKPDSVKVETLAESTESAHDSKAGVPGEADDYDSDDDATYEPPRNKTKKRIVANHPRDGSHSNTNNQSTKKRGRPKKRKLESVSDETVSDDRIPESTKSKESGSKAGESNKKKKQDELFGKHFSMICDLCGAETATFTDLRRHFLEEHQQPKGYVVCCNKQFSKRWAIQSHIDFHTNPSKFRCELCGKNYKTKDTLKSHMLCRHASEEERAFKCDLCPQSFALKTALAHHMVRHTGAAKCEICDKTFVSKGSLTTHMENQHGGKDRAMVCDTCGKEFLTKIRFEQHVNEHMGIEVERFQCGICERWLKGLKNYRNHMECVHADGGRNFECDICLQKYPHLRALQLHKKVHEEPKYECEFCGKKFRKALVLKEHRTTHTGEVLYSCDYCGIPNNNSSNLYTHIKKQHPTEWAQKRLLAAQKNAPP